MVEYNMDLKIKYTESAFGHHILKGSQMAEEEAWALDAEISKDETIEFGPNGTGFLNMRDARLMGLIQQAISKTAIL
ncbi:hypothetical protein AGMMS49928_19590 [Spirochaetia bacterium]|nr:hypothetical protein AGMMS49928_19590 [Spirochaetia bacterium]